MQAVACIGLIIAGGRTLLRPIYRRMADMGNTDVFAATTLLVVLGTSVLTQIAGLSLALGAFLVSPHTRYNHIRKHNPGKATHGCPSAATAPCLLRRSCFWLRNAYRGIHELSQAQGMVLAKHRCSYLVRK